MFIAFKHFQWIDVLKIFSDLMLIQLNIFSDSMLIAFKHFHV